jgi:hypothetical protein
MENSEEWRIFCQLIFQIEYVLPRKIFTLQTRTDLGSLYRFGGN